MGLNIGMRGRDFGKPPLNDFAAGVKRLGLAHVQLAMRLALADIDVSTGRFSPGMARHIHDTIAAAGARVSVLGCYVNPANPDESRRAEAVAAFIEHLKYARIMGTDMVATETGTYEPDYKPSPLTFEPPAYALLLDSVKQIVSAAEKLGVFVALEPVAHHVIHTAELARQILDEINSPNLGLIFDPVNLITADNYEHQAEMMNHFWGLCGKDVLAIHIKDFAMEDGKKISRPIGEGQFDFDTLFKILKRDKPGIHVLVEGTSPERYPAERDYAIAAYERA